MEDLLSSWLVWSLICGLVGFLLGSVKGKPGLGFILGFFFLMIGWIIMLCLSGSRHKCPHCQGALPSADVRRCKHCGSAISGGGPQAAKAERIRQQLAARDPLEEWEAQERMKAGPPAAPDHLKGKQWED